MHIVSCADDNYARHLGGMFVSLLTNMDQNREVKLYVIDGESSLITKKAGRNDIEVRCAD